MTKGHYIVEIIQETVTPVSIYATSASEAKELVLNQQGEPGDGYYLEHRVLSVSLKAPGLVQEPDNHD